MYNTVGEGLGEGSPRPNLSWGLQVGLGSTWSDPFDRDDTTNPIMTEQPV